MKLSDLEGAVIVTEDGARLGHVFDLRAHGRPAPNSDQTMGPVDLVVYGKLGLLERLGIRRFRGQTLEWKSVVAFRDGKLVVRI